MRAKALKALTWLAWIATGFGLYRFFTTLGHVQRNDSNYFTIMGSLWLAAIVFMVVATIKDEENA